MFRTQKKRVSERTNFGKEIVRDQDYPDRLNFYATPPLSEITIDEFEEWAIDRLRVLNEIETCLYKNRGVKTMEQAIRPVLDKYLPMAPNPSVASRGAKSSQLDEERKKDHCSHFILRLAFCRSEELRHRFIKSETTLFRLRYTTADIAEQHALLTRYDFGWTPVSETEKRELGESLSFASDYNPNVNESYFKVPFERVPELVEARKVYIEDGIAYVPESQQLALILTEFSDRLSRALEITARALPRLDEDDRLLPILKHLSSGFVGPEYNPDYADGENEAGIVRAAQVDSLVQHFPLCMSTLHAALRRDQHLKYHGRMQYGLFLKGIGLTVEEALIFWRQSFAKFTDDKFAKDYRYNIRHNYGLEGSRKNYKPYSCQQILSDNAPTGNEYHGCPFRHFSEDNLVHAVEGLGVADKTVLRSIREDVRNKHFHVACTRVFEATHKSPGVKSTVGVGPGMESITHPNLYYDRSLRFAKQVSEVENADASAVAD
ncbi:eukaryotic and archaeal DNA primase, large subunit-domain-containing protein, partial [Lipomyces arxii]|uniref:eukaryotic and archaeal DNA primase, large subunit-domain-containing protein n=1 Tax=Lipomyces arxii TaxID=56418 RepID=UPI0034CD5892